MDNVPNIISTKDLSYIEDMLNWNFTLIKKINNYIDCVENKDVINTLKKCYKQLNKNYDDLLELLD